MEASLSYLCTYLNTPLAYTSANSIRYSKKEFNLCRAGLYSFRGRHPPPRDRLLTINKPHLDMALPSKHSSSARGRNLDDWGVGAFCRQNVCVHRGPDSEKGPLLCFMLHCGHVAILEFSFKVRGSAFQFCTGPHKFCS